MSTAQDIQPANGVFYRVVPDSPIPRAVDTLVLVNGERVGNFSGLPQSRPEEAYPGLQMCTIEEFKKLQEDAARTEPSQITENGFHAALRALPPERHEKRGDVLFFTCSEYYVASITAFYAYHKGRYWTFRDRFDLPDDAVAEKIKRAGPPQDS